jgi:methionyl-tRNA synthetase
MKKFPGRIYESLHAYRFREALAEMMNLARLGNKYLTDSEPWKLAETDPERVATIMNISLQICAQLSIVMDPFLPFSAEKIRRMLNFGSRKWKDAAEPDWLQPGHKTGKPELLFDKIEDKAIEAQVQRLLDSKKNNEAMEEKLKPSKSMIGYADFEKMDIRVATVLEAEKIPKTSKLMKLKVDTGLDQRTLVAGIAEHYEPAQVVGRRICILANLEPRKLKGIESQGMILMAENPDGKLYFVLPSDGAENGADIK